MSRFYELLAIGLILLITSLVYLPALQGDRLWDDDAHITKPELRSVEGLYRIWFEPGVTQQYYPLLHTAFWLEHKLWGDSLLGYHLVTLFWHMLSTVLIFVILKRLEIPGALLAAAIFAVHPVMVESVAWISEQKNTLSAVFYLGAGFAFLQFVDTNSRAAYFAALALFVLALLAKTVAVTLPVSLLLILWWRKGTLSWWRDIWPLLPFFALSIAAGLMTLWVERNVVGTQGADFELNYLERFILAGRAIWFYLSKLLWPSNVAFIYPRWTIDPAQWWQWLFPSTAILMTIGLWAVRRRWRGPLAGWLFFCGTLFPVLGFFNTYYFIYSFVADHLQYLPSIGIIVLAAAAITHSISRLPPASRIFGPALCTILVATLAALAWRQTRNFTDGVTYNQSVLDRNPNCWIALNNLGVALAAMGDHQQAIEHYRTGIGLKPDFADLHNNLGYSLVQCERLPEAITELTTAIAMNPHDYNARNNLGLALFNSHRLPEAIEAFQAALAIKPNSALILNNLGNALARSGRLPEAVEKLQAALELEQKLPPTAAAESSNEGNAISTYASAINNLGIALIDMGRFPEAIEHLNHALQLNPDYAEAHSNLGNALTKAGHLPEAIDELQTALALQPDYPTALNNLGIALTQAGRFPEAVEQLERALRLKPDYGDAHNNLGIALSRSGKVSQAIEQFQLALKIDPLDANTHFNFGNMLAGAGEMKQAIEHFEQSVRLRPGSAEMQYALAEALRLGGRTPESIEHYQAAIKRNPNFMPAYANLAQAYTFANQPKEAIATSERALEVARSSGQKELVEKIEGWLKKNRVPAPAAANIDSSQSPDPADKKAPRP